MIFFFDLSEDCLAKEIPNTNTYFLLALPRYKDQTLKKKIVQEHRICETIQYKQYFLNMYKLLYSSPHVISHTFCKKRVIL